MPASCRLRIAATEQIVDHKNGISRECRNSASLIPGIQPDELSLRTTVGAFGLALLAYVKSQYQNKRKENAKVKKLVKTALSRLQDQVSRCVEKFWRFGANGLRSRYSNTRTTLILFRLPSLSFVRISCGTLSSTIFITPAHDRGFGLRSSRSSRRTQTSVSENKRLWAIRGRRVFGLKTQSPTSVKLT